MTAAMHLTITTPASVLVDAADVVALRAEDESGGFGVLSGHADLMTVLPSSVVRWRDGGGAERFCAVRAGVLTVSERGRRIAIACRQGTVGDDLAALEADVAEMRAAETDADRRKRVEQMRLHARAVRQLMRYLAPGQPGGGQVGEAPATPAEELP